MSECNQCNQLPILGSGCGSVGGAVAYDTRDLQFESRLQQNFIYLLFNRKDKNKEKEAGNGPSLKKLIVNNGGMP